jgi:hypothetical protein
LEMPSDGAKGREKALGVESQLLWAIPKLSVPAYCKETHPSDTMSSMECDLTRSTISMTQNEMNALSSLLHLPARVTVASIHPGASELVIRIACTSPSMACPECHQLSTRIHGVYQRIVADLPCAGRDVILLLTVRKFVCGTSMCPQRIFDSAAS